MTPTRYVVFQLVFTDGKIDIALSYVHRQYLIYLANRGGEAEMDYTIAGLNPEQMAHLRRLDKEFRCINETKVIGRSSLYHHRLTDIGRNIVTKIIESGENMGEVETMVNGSAKS